MQHCQPDICRVKVALILSVNVVTDDVAGGGIYGTTQEVFDVSGGGIYGTTGGV